MANFKHRKPRVSRSGCKLCKPHKIGGNHSSNTKAKYRLGMDFGFAKLKTS